MAAPKKTLTNPQGLTIKQALVIADVVETAKQGKAPNLAKSVKKFYEVAKDNTASVMAFENFNKPNFRDALIQSLVQNKIIGIDGKVNQRLREGLDAKTFDFQRDYKIRLDYIKEINHITGVYAPDKKQTKSLVFNLDIPLDQVKKRLKVLQSELSS